MGFGPTTQLCKARLLRSTVQLTRNAAKHSLVTRPFSTQAGGACQPVVGATIRYDVAVDPFLGICIAREGKKNG